MKAAGDLGRLLGDLHAVVFERRGILLLLEDEWHKDRPGYWSRVFDVMSDRFSALARITLAQSVVRLSRDPADLEPLVEATGVAEGSQQALRAVRSLFGMAGADPQVVEYAPWLRACSLLAQRRRDDVLGLCTTLILCLFDRNRSRSPHQLTLLSSAARQLFTVAWEKESVDPAIIPGVVQAIIETFEAAPVESAMLLEEALRARSHRAWPMCVLWQAKMADQLLGKPELVAEIYSAVVDVFSADEAAHDAAEVSWLEQARIAETEGRQLPPVALRKPETVRRDAIDALENHVKKFVLAAPLLATRTLVRCIDRWLSRNDAQHGGAPAPISLSLRGNSFSFVQRLTYLSPNEFSSAFCGGIISRLGECDDSEFSSHIDALITAPASGIVWEAIINAAAHDARLRSVIQEWLEQPEALRAFADAFSRLISSDSLSEIDKTRIRHTLDQLSIDSSARLELESALASPKSNPDFSKTIAVVGDDGGDFWLRSWLKLSPDDVAAASNDRLIVLVQQAGRLESELSTQDSDALKFKRAEAAQLIEELQVALREPANPRLVTYAWCALAGLASSYVGASAEMDPDVLLAASEREDSLVDPGIQSKDLINKARSVPRARSIKGLMILLQRVRDERVLAAIERLSMDAEAAVRSEVAWHLHFLSKVSHGRLWSIVSRLVHDEDVVVASWAVHRLGIFFRLDAERALQLSAEALRRFDKASLLVSRVRVDALFQLAWYHLTQGNKMATCAINHAIESINVNTTGFDELLHAYRKWITLGDDDGDDEDNGIRKRTHELFARIARASIQALSSSSTGNLNARIRTDRPPQAQLLESLAAQLYFASGAFNDKHGDAPLSGETMARFYVETRDLLLELGTAGVISVAERVLEILQYLLFTAEIPDPSEVRHRFVEIAESAIEGGLGDEVWRLDPIEDVLRRLIAEDPSQFDESMLSAWDRIVGALVEKGWRQAFLLARDFDLSS